MVMTMAENVIRKACDRCHAQKLSCKRINDEACERCLRLKTECKSSPSLRYKKGQPSASSQGVIQTQSQNQVQVQVQVQPQDPTRSQSQQPHQQAVAEAFPSGRRSPKRRRTDIESNLVPPQTGKYPSLPILTHVSIVLATDSPRAEAVPIISHTGGLPSKNLPVVTPDPSLEIGDFNFTFDQLDFFAPSQPEHLSHQGVPGAISDLHPQLAFTDTWDPRLGSSTDAYQVVAPHLHHQLDIHPPQQVVPQVHQENHSCVPGHNSSDKHIRARTRQRPRQITLRQSFNRPLHQGEAPEVHWMAQLSDINTRLLDLSSVLPSQREAAQNGPSLSRPTDERFSSQGFPIDEMFKLTRRVAEILEHPSSGTSESNKTKARNENVDSSDPGNSMFIISTYVRLLDMYQRVFSLVHTELSQAGPAAMFRFWKLPDVTIGSFAVESSEYLQMSLTIQLAEEFLSRLRKATAALGLGGHGNPSNTSPDSAFSGVIGISFQAVKEQEQSLAKHLMELRGNIEVLLES